MSAAGPSWPPCFSPQGNWPNVPGAAVQAALRTVFDRWGRPQRLRVDNGGPWGSTSGLPTVMELWLVGLGVDVTRNHPRTPQENGVVERSQGTGKRWAEPGQCLSLAQLQQRVNEEDRLQREEYPYRGSCSRRDTFAELLHSGRGYAAGWETLCWDLERATAHLAGYRVPRKVSSEGKVSVYERDRHVGRERAGQRVWVEFAASAQLWRILDADGHELRCCPAPEMTREGIIGLCLGRRRATPPQG